MSVSFLYASTTNDGLKSDRKNRGKKTHEESQKCLNEMESDLLNQKNRLTPSEEACILGQLWFKSSHAKLDAHHQWTRLR